MIPLLIRTSYHGYQTGSLGRRVATEDDHYIVTSIRVYCGDCHVKYKVAKAAATQNAPVGAKIKRADVHADAYTFSAMHPYTLSKMEHSAGELFPAILSHKTGIDKSCIDKLRPSSNSGMAPEAYASMVSELHYKRHSQEELIWEEKLCRLDQALARKSPKFSPYNSRSGYAGYHPSPKYFRDAYKHWHTTVRGHYDQQVKLRGGQDIDIDASYKLKDRLAQCHGENIFGTLQTGTNEFTEIRLQFFAITDGFDQMKQQLREMQHTMDVFGQRKIRMVKVDNPAQVGKLYQQEIQSLLQKPKPPPSHNCQELPLQRDRVHIHKTIPAIRAWAQGVRDHIKQGDVLSLDAEWDTILGCNGNVIGSEKLALLQIAYDLGGGPEVALLQLYDKRQLCTELCTLLSDTRISYVGRNLGGDDSKLHDAFPTARFSIHHLIELGSFCRERDPITVPSGTAGLQELTQRVLGFDLPKGPVRLSTWSAQSLDEEQICYAARDPLAALLIYNKLAHLPDLSARLEAHEAIAGEAIDVLASTGTISVLATVLASGTILPSPDTWINPVNQRVVNLTASRRLVQIHSVAATASKLPSFLRQQKLPKFTFAEFIEKAGSTNFTIVLPLSMLRLHAPETSQQDPTAQPNSQGPPEGCQFESGTNANGDYESADHEQQSEVEDTHDDACGWVPDFGDLLSGEDGVEFTEDEIDAVRECRLKVLAATEAAMRAVKVAAVDSENYSFVLGDAFHAEDRAKVPVHHCYKKAYHIALRDAMLPMDKAVLADVKAVLKEKHHLTDAEIESKLLYKFDYFRKRVPRHSPAPSILLARVKAVFIFFCNAPDPKYGPLFGATARKKATGVLCDIADGLLSDPPGVSFNKFVMDKFGEPLKDADGLQLYRSTRGTSIPECVHHQLVHRFGSWNLGAELACCLLAEFRHRHNIKASERHRLGFPTIGHFDTWLTDRLQLLHIRNHGKPQHRGWTCASAFDVTPETFDVVPLTTQPHMLPPESVTPGVLHKLTADHAYLAKRQGTQLPYLPVHTRKEKALFSRLATEGLKDWDEVARKWSASVDGVLVFPKIPAQLRIYFKKWEKSSKVLHEQCLA